MVVTVPPTRWQKIVYAPLGALLWLMAHMPFRLLYILSDFIAWLACYVVRYRRHLVAENIRRCFPQMDGRGLKHNVWMFYRHLADYFVETLKLTSMSDEQMRRRFVFKGIEVVDKAFDRGKDIVLYTSHFANWEWVTSIALWTRHPEAKYSHVYQPQSNVWFDNWFHRTRSRYNVSIARNHVLRQFVEWHRAGQRFVTGFLSDQRPGPSGSKVSVDFFGHPMHFIQGTEELARKFKTAVVWMDTRLVKRGYYETEVMLLADDASETEPGELTARYAAALETAIRRTPYAYLWSHNRWRDES